MPTGMMIMTDTYRDNMKKVDEIKAIHDLFVRAESEANEVYCSKSDRYILNPRRSKLFNKADSTVSVTGKSWGIDHDRVISLVNIVPEGTKAILNALKY